MIVFNIAEWIINFLVLGVSICFWAGGIFMVTMLVTVLKDYIVSFFEK
tara:strand:- start:617 stop:760 length:144 start_codon:yes stop_codon:yes gene_type:complete